MFVARDFDKPGFSILETLRSDTRRHKYKTKPNIIDLGLRLADAKAMGLLSEPVSYSSNVSPAERLRECGATEDEIDLLVSDGEEKAWTGERIELNAMTSRQFIDWLESGLTKHGVKKLIPDDDARKDGYRRAVQLRKIQAAIDAAIDEDEQQEIEPPSNLRDQISEMLEENPEMPWDAAVAEIALADEE